MKIIIPPHGLDVTTHQDDDAVDQDRAGVHQRDEHSLTVEILEGEKPLVILSHPGIDLLCGSNTTNCFFLFLTILNLSRKNTHGI